MIILEFVHNINYYYVGVHLYTCRVSMQLDCRMLLRKYPMDNQTCHMNLGSCEYNINYFKFLFIYVFSG